MCIRDSDKTVYRVGETFDPAGGVLRLEYAGGGWAERPLSVELCQAAAFDSPGEKSVLVTLEGKTTSFAVAVADNPVTGLVLLSLPQRLTYQLGEELVVAGGRLQDVYKRQVEGCLSNPGWWGKTIRPQRVRVEALDREGTPISIEGEGALAKCLCHELDHLDGVVFWEKAICQVFPQEQSQ